MNSAPLSGRGPFWNALKVVLEAFQGVCRGGSWRSPASRALTSLKDLRGKAASGCSPGAIAPLAGPDGSGTGQAASGRHLGIVRSSLDARRLLADRIGGGYLESETESRQILARVVVGLGELGQAGGVWPRFL